MGKLQRKERWEGKTDEKENKGAKTNWKGKGLLSSRKKEKLKKVEVCDEEKGGEKEVNRRH